jgi:ribosomal protein S18 acetylase RimI-like enzyme
MTSQLRLALSLTKPQRPIDLDALYVIYRASMYHSTNKARGKPWNDRRERRQFIEQVNPDTVALIEVDGAIAGFIDLRSEDGALIVHTLVLHSQHQSKGIGTAVMQGICNMADKKGCQIKLFVLRANSGAKRFYRRLGFKVASSSTYHEHMIYHGQSHHDER